MVLDDDDWVQVILTPQSWANPISTPLHQKRDMSIEVIMTLVLDSAQSSVDFNIGDGVIVEFVTVRKATEAEQRGGSKFIKSSVASSHLAFNLRSMVKMFNDSEQMCMVRSIAVGISFATNNPHWNEMRKP
jgi:hypothetical protein